MGISHRVGSPILTNAPHSFSTAPVTNNSADTTATNVTHLSTDTVSSSKQLNSSVIPPYQPANPETEGLIMSNVNIYADEDSDTNDDNYVQFEKVNELIAQTVASLAAMEQTSSLQPSSVNLVVTSAQVHPPPPGVATVDSSPIPAEAGEKQSCVSPSEEALQPENVTETDETHSANEFSSEVNIQAENAASPKETLYIQSKAIQPAEKVEVKRSPLPTEKLQIHTVVLTADPGKVLSPNRGNGNTKDTGAYNSSTSFTNCDQVSVKESSMALEPVAEEHEHEAEEEQDEDLTKKEEDLQSSDLASATRDTVDTTGLVQAETKQSQIEVPLNVNITDRASPERKLLQLQPKQSATSVVRKPRSPRTPKSPGSAMVAEFEFPVVVSNELNNF